MRSRQIAALLVLAALLLVACGGDSGPSRDAGSTATEVTPIETGSKAEVPGEEDAEPADETKMPSDEKLIEEAIGLFLSGEDPEIACSDAVTERFVRHSFGDHAGCVLSRDPRSLAKSSRISALEIDDGTASAEATPKGGVYDRLPVDLVLVRDGANWRIDEISADVPVGP